MSGVAGGCDASRRCIHAGRHVECDVQGSDDMWYKHIQPQLERIVVWSLQSAQDMVRGGCKRSYSCSICVNQRPCGVCVCVVGVGSLAHRS